MSKSALSVFVFGLYLSILALRFLIFPNTVLSLFNLPNTNEVWVRAVGMLLFGLSYYYIQMPLLEVHLLDFAGDLYRRHLQVRFLKKLRDERKYDDVPQLRAAIARDAEAARRYFSTKTNA